MDVYQKYHTEEKVNFYAGEGGWKRKPSHIVGGIGKLVKPLWKTA